MKLEQIAKKLNINIEDNSEIEINGVASLSDAKIGEISFLSNRKYKNLLSKTKASVILVPLDFNEKSNSILLKVKNPDKVFSEIALLFYKFPPQPLPEIHPSVVIGVGVSFGRNICIGPNCVIEDGVKIGDNTIISPNCVIGYESVIGSHVKLFPSVSLREYSVLGNRVIIHNSSVIGSDGFGYTLEVDGTRTKIPQIGFVVIEDDVEIGANVAIDRARFGKTVIGKGTKIDNLVQIAHNVIIGENTIICGQTGIAGSSNIGSNTILAGQVGVCGHLTVGDKVIVNAQSGITKNISDGEHIMGMPAVNNLDYNKAYAGMLKLSKLKERITNLENIIKDKLN